MANLPTYTLDDSKLILSILDEWGTSAEQKIMLLALEELVKPRNLTRYRKTEALPNVPEVQARMDHIFGIAEALRTMYPH